MNIPNLNEARKRNSNKTVITRDDYIVPNSMKNIGEGKKYCVITYGCQMNVHDSENISAIMEDMGYSKSLDYLDSDVIIINTCAIRENAHNKVFGMLGRIKHYKENTDKNVVTVFCGCMAQEEVICNEIHDKYKWIDIVMGTHNIHKLPLYLENVLDKESSTDFEVFSIEGGVYENVPVKRDSKYKAWINIMYGCDKFCTYCIVPYTRGKQRSRMPEDIINEVNNLVKNGYKEVTLLGQNVNAYGKDLGINYDMADLLRDVSNTGIDRVRFVTGHPWDFSLKMLEVIGKYSNIMPYIHLPLQSGSDNILKRMNRRYTKDEYLELVSNIRKYIPNASISTDIIVGFPGETDEDFNDTLEVVNAVKYDLAYTFIYSPREGTPAASYKDDIGMDVKKKRLSVLNDLINKYALLNNQKYMGKVVRVLIEGESEKAGKFMGYTEDMKLVNVSCSSELVGSIVDVLITDVKTWSMDGEVVDDRK